MELGFWADSPEVHDYLDARIREILNGTAASWGVGVDIKLIGKSPGGEQDAELAALVQDAATRVPGIETIDDSAECRAGEDAFFFITRVTELGKKAVYMLIGSDLTDGHHTSRFDFDEQSLVYGTALLSETAAGLLRRVA